MKKNDEEHLQESGAQEETEEYLAEEKLRADKLAGDIASLQTELQQLQADAAESHNNYLRTLADFDNFRKRQRDEIARQVNLVRDELMLKILSIVDNFDRALEAAETPHSYESLVEGVTLILRQMKELLEKEGVQPIEAVGGQFDPEFHEAMMRIETDEYPDNTVVDEFEKGYTISGKVLRPSRVRVAKSSD